jgi:pimeloyl-ACP methyl ester carboxylesterase
MEFRTISGGGLPQVVSTAGEGPDIVLLHGFPDTPDSFSDLQAELVGAGWRVSVPWLRGYHPDNIVPGRRYDPETLGHDVLAGLDAVGAERAVLVGHDWGALLAYVAAAQAPERIPAIVTLGIPHPSLLVGSLSVLWAGRHFLALKMPGAAARARRNDYAYLDLLYRRWAPGWTGPERDETVNRAKLALARDGTLGGAISYYRDLPLRPVPALARAPNVPGLIIGGTTDGGHPASYERTAELMGEGSRALILPGAGHWPHREQPEVVRPELMRFVSDVRASAG